MTQILKGLLLSATLLIGGQSVCSDSTKGGWNFSSFKFLSCRLPAWPAMLSFSSVRSSYTLPTLSKTEKIAIGGGTGIGLAAIWVYLRQSAQRKNRVALVQQQLAIQKQADRTSVSQPQSNYCQEIGCWQTGPNCPIHSTANEQRKKLRADLVEAQLVLQEQVDSPEFIKRKDQVESLIIDIGKTLTKLIIF